MSHYYVGHDIVGWKPSLPVPDGCIEVTQQQHDDADERLGMGGGIRIYDNQMVLVGPERYECWNKSNKSPYSWTVGQYGLPFVGEPIPDGYTNVEPTSNYPYIVFDEVENDWVKDDALFTAFAFEHLDGHLQEFLSSRHLYVVDSVDAYFKNDLQTRSAIADYVDDVDAVNDPAYEVRFKAQDENSNTLWIGLNGGNIKGLANSLTTRMKNAFDAVEEVQTTHSITPYATVQDMLDAFDTIMGV